MNTRLTLIRTGEWTREGSERVVSGAAEAGPDFGTLDVGHGVPG